MPADEFRKYYAGLSEEGLREIDSRDLTETARACYEEELAKRGLTIEDGAPKLQPEPLMRDAGWVALDTFNPEEIELVRALLEAEEIPTDMDPTPSENYPPQAAGSVLFVPEQFLARAREVLAADVSEEELIAEAEAEEPPEDA